MVVALPDEWDEFSFTAQILLSACGFTLSNGSYQKFSGYALFSELSQKGSVEQIVVEVPSFIHCSWSERNIAVPMGEGLMPLWMSMCTSVLSRIFEMLRWWKTQMINFEGNISLVFRQYLNVMNFQHPGQRSVLSETKLSSEYLNMILKLILRNLDTKMHSTVIQTFVLFPFLIKMVLLCGSPRYL